MKLDETVEKNHHTRKFDKGLIGDVKIKFYKMINDEIINKFCKIYLIKFLLLLKLLLFVFSKAFSKISFGGKSSLLLFFAFEKKESYTSF